MAAVRCPECDRRLPPPATPGAVTCDGCGCRFDPGHVRYRPAPAWRRVLGALVLGLGGLTLLNSIRTIATGIDWRAPAARGQVLTACLVPIGLLSGGAALGRGRRVLVAPDPAPGGPIPPGPG